MPPTVSLKKWHLRKEPEITSKFSTDHWEALTSSANHQQYENSALIPQLSFPRETSAFKIISCFLKLVDRQGNFLWLSLHSWQFCWSSEGKFICGKSKGRPVSLAATFGERHCMTRQILLWGRLKERIRRKNGLSSEGLMPQQNSWPCKGKPYVLLFPLGLPLLVDKKEPRITYHGKYHLLWYEPYYLIYTTVMWGEIRCDDS